MVREGLDFQALDKVPWPPNHAADVHCVEVFPRAGTAVLVINAYLPPARMQGCCRNVSLAFPRSLPQHPFQLLAGDLNGHHPAWDDNVDEDSRGTVPHNWADESEMPCLNTGGPTRWMKGHGTAPAVTFVSDAEAGRCDWASLPAVGGGPRSHPGRRPGRRAAPQRGTAPRHSGLASRGLQAGRGHRNTRAHTHAV